ncbi:hypothetical protein, partial [Tabrizicola sp.]|uniref:hypothetical protein n=1 Tax=Tabrizicola sp. TaxID=2005166 RepID=UPI00260A16B4
SPQPSCSGYETRTSPDPNQLSHGGIPSVTQHEVQGALTAVGTLLFSLKVNPTNAKQEVQ